MHLRIAILGVLALAFVVSAAAPPPPPPTPFGKAAADQLDYLYLASDEPVLIRLHLRAGDKPFSATWEVWMDKLFVWFDKDNNGELSGAETARIMQGQTLSFQLQGAIGAGNSGSVPFASVDTNKDGKVSKEEFRAYYRTSGINPLRFSYNNAPAQTARQVNDAIYRRLGRDGKSKLAKVDVAKLPGLLPKLDENEDEALATSEINTSGDSGQGVYAVPLQLDGPRMTPNANEPGLTEIQPKMTAAQLAALITAHYDANRDGNLTAGEKGLSKSFVERFDKNKDGKVDRKELEAFFWREPDLMIRARVGALQDGMMGLIARTGLFGKMARAEMMNESKLSPALAKKVKKVDSDSLAFAFGDTQFTLTASEGQSGNRLQGVKQFYLQQFDGALDGKEFLARGKESDGNRFVMQMFNQADRNADGKLYKKEFSEWLDLVGDGGNAFVTLQVTDSGRNLFNLLDLNGDGRLSIRELRTAWARIEPVCKDSGGLLQGDLPRTLQVAMYQGFNNNRQGFVAFGQPMAAPAPAKVGSVPMWFTKMDRNNDGDISVKEWLGSEEDFAAIDTDKDGLLSPAEARAFDAKKKK